MNQCLSFSSSPSGLCQMMSINSIYTIPLHPPDPASTWHHHVVGASPQESNRKCCTMVILRASNFLTHLNPFNTYCFSWNKTPFCRVKQWNGEPLLRRDPTNLRLWLRGFVDSFGFVCNGNWNGIILFLVWTLGKKYSELKRLYWKLRNFLPTPMMVLSMLHCPFFLYHPEIPSLHPLSASSHWWPEKKSTVKPPSLKLFIKISHFNLTFPPK